MVKQKTAVLIPSYRRADKLTTCLSSLSKSLSDNERDLVDIFVGLDKHDANSEDVAITRGAMVEWIASNGSGSVPVWNELLRRHPDYQYYVAAADDLVFYPGWLGKSLGAMNVLGYGLVGFNDMNRDGSELATHWIADRDFLIKYNGGVIYAPWYKSQWCDPELNEIAKRAGRFTWCEDALVEHIHPNYGKSPSDATYRISESNESLDRDVYNIRRDNMFPINWEPILR